MKFRCVIFDLDGTLVDTIDDIAGAMNRALVSQGFSPVPPGAYPSMVGWGFRRLAYLSLPPAAREDTTVEALTAAAVRFYAERPIVHSKPYRGIPELAADLRRKKIKTAVLTNKPDPVARLVVGGLFPRGSFDAVYGDRPGFPRKPDPAGVWEILMELDKTPRETILVGDSEIDVETAHASGCHALGVSWGFRGRAALETAGADRIIDRPGELPGLLDIRL
ncbi:MAG: HAD family hydrolase [Spirochaetaceae bacterium]|jgi:phosphoglycolate phosphatase|nr:HAD family hydrolase [Spirochaetaceae bacterium]